MTAANAWALATLVATAAAAGMALWAQHRFAVIEHVAAIVGYAEALWAANVRWIEVNELLKSPTVRREREEELRTRLFENVNEAARWTGEAGRELCALRVLAPQLSADAEEMVATASASADEEKLMSVAQFAPRRQQLDAATAAFEARVRTEYPLNLLCLPWWQ
jgi:hypothetical protein